jgi:ribonuclease HI
MAQKKFYVVWQGVKPGIYTSWEECKKQVSGFENAQYKSFPAWEDAEKAFRENPWKHLKAKTGKSVAPPLSNSGIIRESLAVDAACSGNPGLLEYRGVYVAENREVFHVGPLEEGTNNIGEFLAIVHALALLKKHQQNRPIYSDSMNAIKWVVKKKCNTKLKQSERNKPLFELIVRAEMWLQNNSYQNPILKWETKQWGEIPADFGRK